MGMFLLVMLFVAAIFVGNMLLLKPSPREQRVMQQLTHAQTLAFKVILRAAPDWLGQPIGSGMVAFYRLSIQHSLSLKGRWRWHAGLQNWQPINHPAAWLVENKLPVPAPNGWLGLEANADSVTVYWKEDGEMASIDLMLQAITALKT
ncbi:MAG: hypothetical protein Q8K94_00370 [Moraxellaceae bacterium]|nr:hypothetical protein [Moraxellaceae bacterium]